MRLDEVHDLPPHGRKDHRAADAGQEGAGERESRIGGAPDEKLADGLDRKRADGDRQPADTIRQPAEQHAHEDEAGAEGRQAETGMAPVAVEKVEDEEGADGGEADALQTDDRTVPPDAADHAPE
jgi:hypothetical protein